MGLRGYADILAAIRVEPKTGQELSAELGRSVASINAVLRRMHALSADLRLVHIAAWKATHAHSVALPAYQAGVGQDAAPPLTFRGRISHHQSIAPAAPSTRSSIVIFAVAMQLLRERPSTRLELSEAAGTGADWLSALLTYMHQTLQTVHVACWTRESGPWLAHFVAGRGPDAPRPIPMTACQRTMTAYYARRVRSGAMTEAQAALQRSNYRPKPKVALAAPAAPPQT
jgi:hypothetical protein